MQIDILDGPLAHRVQYMPVVDDDMVLCTHERLPNQVAGEPVVRNHFRRQYIDSGRFLSRVGYFLVTILCLRYGVFQPNFFRR